MKQSLKFIDIIALGFMLFAFFLGAGNIIFPPLAGQLAGGHYIPAMFGFLLTAVGLPLLSIIAVGISGGSWQHISRDLPSWVSTLMAVVIFIIIGPAFAVPRTGLVSYEMAVQPLLHHATPIDLMLFSVVFFLLAIIFSWSQGKLIDIIGKVLTPVLFLGLIILAVSTFIHPQGMIAAAHGSYVTDPLSQGFLEGYNTMDTFAALMFGILMTDAIARRGITNAKMKTKYLILASFIAAAGLAFVYISLFYLGATSASVVPAANNGGQILSIYVQALFGSYGQWVLSTIVLLACLTTATGVISACADYFNQLTGIDYRIWVLVVGVISAMVANVGLSELINLSLPALFALYPVAIALVTLTYLRSKLRFPQQTYRIILSISLVFALIDAAKTMGINVSMFHFLPLFSLGLGWLPPTVVAIFIAILVGPCCRRQSSENIG